MYPLTQYRKGRRASLCLEQKEKTHFVAKTVEIKDVLRYSSYGVLDTSTPNVHTHTGTSVRYF